MTSFHSEFGEDKWIAKNLPLPEKGFYVDVGCGPPGFGSNTQFLLDSGWNGLAIDANPNYAQHWLGYLNVRFVQAMVSCMPVVPFAFKRVPGHSRVETGHILHAAASLDRLVGHFAKQMVPRPTKIDLLSLDVEGHEFEAIYSLMLLPWAPEIIISEYSTAGLADDYRVKEYLSGPDMPWRYKLVHTTQANHIFQRITRSPSP